MSSAHAGVQGGGGTGAAWDYSGKQLPRQPGREGVMDGCATSLAAEMTPYVSAAVAGYGGAVLARVRDEAADTTVGLGRRLLQRVFGSHGEKEPLPGPLADLAADPSDADALAAVRLALRKTLTADSVLAAEVRSMLASRISSAVLVAVSAAALESVVVRREYEYGHAVGQPLLPVVVDRVRLETLPPLLAPFQMVDYRQPGTKSALAAALAALPDSQALQRPLPDHPPIPVSYLSGLKERSLAATLSMDEQLALIGRLEVALSRAGERDAAEEVLRSLQNRHDLYQVCAREIESLLSPYDRQVSAPQPKEAPSTDRLDWADGPSAPTARERQQVVEQKVRANQELGDNVIRLAGTAEPPQQPKTNPAEWETQVQAPQLNQPKIFLCYRRQDTQGFARGIYERLSGKYGHEQVFRDIDSTPAGVRYSTWIESRVGQCSVMIVLMGDAWLSMTDRSGQRRLDLPKDWVRKEIEAALRDDIPIIPVCVQGAPMPSDDELPPAIAGLTEFQYAEVTDSRWDYDVGRLIQRIDDLITSNENTRNK